MGQWYFYGSNESQNCFRARITWHSLKIVDDIKLQSTKIFSAVSQNTFRCQFYSLVKFSKRLFVTQGLNNGCWIGLVLHWWMLFGSVVFIRLERKSNPFSSVIYLAVSQKLLLMTSNCKLQKNILQYLRTHFDVSSTHLSNSRRGSK